MLLERLLFLRGHLGQLLRRVLRRLLPAPGVEVGLLSVALHSEVPVARARHRHHEGRVLRLQHARGRTHRLRRRGRQRRVRRLGQRAEARGRASGAHGRPHGHRDHLLHLLRARVASGGTARLEWERRQRLLRLRERAAAGGAERGHGGHVRPRRLVYTGPASGHGRGAGVGPWQRRHATSPQGVGRQEEAGASAVRWAGSRAAVQRRGGRRVAGGDAVEAFEDERVQALAAQRGAGGRAQRRAQRRPAPGKVAGAGAAAGAARTAVASWAHPGAAAVAAAGSLDAVLLVELGDGPRGVVVARALVEPRQDAVGDGRGAHAAVDHLLEQPDAGGDVVRLDAAIHKRVVDQLVAPEPAGLHVLGQLQRLVQLADVAVPFEQRGEGNQIWLNVAPWRCHLPE
mmetsp:Transcript_36282/g.97464  ORF Transcript_36282/g.97464 Transcript_36282/m.97464 type:complete len:400 (+) Transcript_36282:473-1672(+)